MRNKIKHIYNNKVTEEMNSTRLSLLIFICSFILIETTFAHDTPVHQYVVKQAYYFLENEKGPIPELRDRIGISFTGAGDDNFPWSTGFIGVAAMREDLEDPIWGFGGAFNGWTPSSTHFWDADNGDDVKTPIPLSTDAFNAYYKAKVYLFGGHNILYQTKAFDPEIGGIILGYLYSYSSIIELYKTGRCFSEGYVDLAGGIHTWAPEELYMNLEAARKMAVQILGRVAHLLTDMSVPAHVHNDLHVPIAENSDQYEDYMSQHYLDGFYEASFIEPIHWDAWNAARQGPLIDVYKVVATNDRVRQIRYLFYTVNQIADRFPSDDNNGDNSYSMSYNGDDYSTLNLIQEITHSYSAGAVQPYEVNKYAFRYCIRAVAGLLYWFAKETNILPPPSLSATISGPSTAPCATGTWSANVSGGYPPYTYQWYQMYASGGGLESSLQKGTIAIQPYKQIDTWYPVGNNTSTLNYYLCGGNSYIRVDVKDSHNTLKSVQQYVAGANGGGGVLPKAEANNSAALSKADLEIPKEYNLEQNYPNPFNPSTIISYSIKTEGRVSLKIYNTLGQELRTLVDEIKPAGSYEAEFNASELPSGIYIYRMQSGDYLSIKKMLLIK